VARGTQHRKRRPPANAGVAHAAVAPKRHKRPAYEEQLFFGRLRTHAKVLFVIMAAVFVLTFVFLGVGSGSTGISQIVQNFFNGTSAGGSSLSSLQKKTVEHPKDAAAWLAYANKLQADKKLDDAATALKTYTTLKPKDTGALNELAGIYTQRAQDWETLYTASQQRTQALSPSPVLAPKSTSKLGQALATITNPLSSAVSSETTSATSNEYSQVVNYLSERLGVYKQLVKLNPQVATSQLNLAAAATDAGDTATEIAAYTAFLKLAPTDSEAPAARKALKAAVAQQKSAAAATATSTSPNGSKATATSNSGKAKGKTPAKSATTTTTSG
jgi:cytochrome c-type biogenesis protein CcmH/NrfG